MALTKEKEKLFQEHSELKARLEREYHELAERKWSFQQETEMLLILNNRIKESVIPSKKSPLFLLCLNNRKKVNAPDNIKKLQNGHVYTSSICAEKNNACFTRDIKRKP